MTFYKEYKDFILHVDLRFSKAVLLHRPPSRSLIINQFSFHVLYIGIFFINNIKFNGPSLTGIAYPLIREKQYLFCSCSSFGSRLDFNNVLFHPSQLFIYKNRRLEIVKIWKLVSMVISNCSWILIAKVPFIGKGHIKKNLLYGQSNNHEVR